MTTRPTVEEIARGISSCPDWHGSALPTPSSQGAICCIMRYQIAAALQAERTRAEKAEAEVKRLKAELRFRDGAIAVAFREDLISIELDEESLYDSTEIDRLYLDAFLEVAVDCEPLLKRDRDAARRKGGEGEG